MRKKIAADAHVNRCQRLTTSPTIKYIQLEILVTLISGLVSFLDLIITHHPLFTVFFYDFVRVFYSFSRCMC